MNILIIGCGRVGTSLAYTLSKNGHDVSVLDENIENLEKLHRDFNGLIFNGVPIDVDNLSNAGINSCDVVCAVSDEDNINLMVSQMARKIYNTKIVLTRVFDDVKGEIYETMGLDTINSTALTVDAICSALDEYEKEQYISYGSKKMKFYTIEVPKSHFGRKINEIEFEEGEVLYAVIKADGTIKLINNYNIVLHEGDELVFSKII